LSFCKNIETIDIHPPIGVLLVNQIYKDIIPPWENPPINILE